MVNHPDLKKIQIKRWKLRRAVLGAVILGILSGGGSWRRPTLPLLIEGIIEYFKEEYRLNLKEQKISKLLADFETKDILNFDEQNDTVYVTLNKKNPKVIRYSIKTLIDFKIKKKSFAGKWYMVFFDVPELQRNKRDQLRNFLEKLGFYRYQKSVYILPYSCEEEVKLIKQIIEGAKYMKYIIADRIEDEEKIKKHYHLL